ncbi:hypothetical protein [Corynebacterium lubricantis]|uniref:hypothetical protein n=1 Tax=Corynebacterium lubricantis TaxID=541095 RepID=UPI00037B4E9D|nr:hypothetical protein [Corynebacterium lubricantis]
MANHEYKAQFFIKDWEDMEDPTHDCVIFHDNYQGAYDQISDEANWDGDKWVEGIPDGYRIVRRTVGEWEEA